MKKYFTSIFIIIVLLLLVPFVASSVWAQTTGGDDDDYSSNIYISPNGDSMVVKTNSRIVLRTGARVMGGVDYELTGDSIIVKSGGYLVLQSGSNLVAGDKIASTDTIQISSGGTLYIASGGRGQFADKVTTTDTVDIASGGALIVSSGGRFQLNSGSNWSINDTLVISSNDSVNIASGGNFVIKSGGQGTVYDTLNIASGGTMRVSAGGILKASGIANMDTANIDSTRSKTASIDTLFLQKVIRVPSGNLTAGVKAFSGADSGNVYVAGMKTTDLVFATIKGAGTGVKPDSIGVRVFPDTDTLRISVTKTLTGSVYWFRIVSP